MWLLDAGNDADLMPLAVELVDGVVAERVDEDVPAPTDEHVIGRRHGRETKLVRGKNPERAALVGNEDAPRRIDSGPHRTHHSARDLRCGLTVGAHTPHDAVWTIRHDHVVRRREEIARGIQTREHGANAIDAVAAGPIRKRAPLADGVRLPVDRDDAVAPLLGDQDAPVGLHRDPFRRRHPTRDALDRPVGIQRRDGARLDVAEEQPPIVVEREVVGSRLLLQKHLRTGRG